MTTDNNLLTDDEALKLLNGIQGKQKKDTHEHSVFGLRIPTKLRERLFTLAADQEKTVTAIILDSIRDHLAKIDQSEKNQ